ncbi:ABC transporter ATP-binding protein [Hyphomicrobiales bacterium 4NK60-0047b]|jgi:ABC-type polysaccharide/polyol phosphate transport system ATPase subunit
MSLPLIDAKSLQLKVPIFQPEDRNMLANPTSFLTDLYFSKTQRGIVTLLEDVSFSLMQGERLGIVGANGAGKSTLLRLLAGIYQPSEGLLNINGVAKGLFDISMGMNNEATGLENIYMRGLLMGMPVQQIRDLLPEILEFSELKEAIDKPLNTYSTGMRLRLAFSVATMIEPDILLLDEWIGTGDASFRGKVKKRMDDLVEKSRGLVLATHNTSLMKELCTHGLYLKKGKIAFYGKVEEALEFYSDDLKK